MTETSYAGAEIERSQDQLTSDAVKEAQEVTSQVAEKASDLREQASSRARDELNSRSGTVPPGRSLPSRRRYAERADNFARRTVTAGPTGRSGGGTESSASASTCERPTPTGCSTTSKAARRRTWLVAAGGMAAGLAASRLLKASSSRRYASDGGARTERLSDRRGRYAELPSGDAVRGGGEPRRHPATGV